MKPTQIIFFFLLAVAVLAADELADPGVTSGSAVNPNWKGPVNNGVSRETREASENNANDVDDDDDSGADDGELDLENTTGSGSTPATPPSDVSKPNTQPTAEKAPATPPASQDKSSQQQQPQQQKNTGQQISAALSSMIVIVLIHIFLL
ncbi:hypothetical protein HDU92_003276 [Lobulomyces angularis]|nr:hypothetical protein HDU92_003276 [Lobulomyces angularis]